MKIYLTLSLVLILTSAKAASFEWSQAVPPSWSAKDAAQNQPVQVIEGQAYDSNSQKQYKVGDFISQWTECSSETETSDHVLTSADVQSTYELELEAPGILKQIDLWVDNSSEYRNAADVEILVSFDGETFEKVIATGNQCGTKVVEGTCNVLTFDLSDQNKPARKVRIVDKLAVTAVQGPRSPHWLQWDVFVKP